jgi:hypothetical protein
MNYPKTIEFIWLLHLSEADSHTSELRNICMRTDCNCVGFSIRPMRFVFRSTCVLLNTECSCMCRFSLWKPERMPVIQVTVFCFIYCNYKQTASKIIIHIVKNRPTLCPSISLNTHNLKRFPIKCVRLDGICRSISRLVRVSWIIINFLENGQRFWNSCKNCSTVSTFSCTLCLCLTSSVLPLTFPVQIFSVYYFPYNFNMPSPSQPS